MIDQNISWRDTMIPQLQQDQSVKGSGKDDASEMPAKVLQQTDLIAFGILSVLWISIASGMQFAGPTGLLYLVAGFVLFLAPTAFISQWLGRRFPRDNAPFGWSLKTIGSRWAFFAVFCGWLAVTISIVIPLSNVELALQFFNETWFTSSSSQAIGMLVLDLFQTPSSRLQLPIVDTSNQVEPESKPFSSVAVFVRDDPESF
jgi:amino acid transporter